jgi:GNAT superfamily N-acetyltransferase
MTSIDYRLLPLDDSTTGIRQISVLLNNVFPAAKHLTESYLAWQYLENPTGTAVGFNAWMGNELAAHYVAIPVRYGLDGEELTGVLSLNTATHPDHQGKRLFTLLAERTYEEAARRGHSFVIGVANANSSPGFVKKLGFQLVTQLEALLYLGPAPVRDDRCRSFERTWDRKTVAWRVGNPALQYGRSLAGGRFRIEAPTGTFGIKADLGDFPLSLQPDPPWSPRVLPHPITLWIGWDERRTSRGLRGFAVPDRFRRSPLNLIYKALDGRLPKVEPEQVRLQALDFDPY